ncbi:phospholipid/cholesterol/gamma-HCH transport system substrate-binding protein [Halopolyspora algeriensis]|uniref:Phospholipid/cholesterol/gamma-HCH transport system substrate-binding protein n=1 Tax=Halopolyspora algeriensis TaxID=1500506 RepID=A0A368VZI8_9ACTN|nr:MlaD family protein [Halopolyspora algeriensis]RCW46792.1 phospholipid/cholesterol/gamma-HCH transport system substrate-binding protein [Halopolyspora algeriensis]TQM39210.1 phospholipid/cholesterol/gamma-HCH transport system substrate-binding protein [Halopolyspora algeriensis]
MNARSLTGPLVKFLIFVLVTVLATGVLIATIANESLRSSKSYSALFTDVTGLSEGDEVRISGVKVGEVEDIRVVDHGTAKIRFSVSERRLPESVTAAVKWRNLIGQRYVALERGAGPVDEFMDAGETIPVERTKPPLDLSALLGGFQPLFEALTPKEVNKLSFEIIQVLQGEAGTVESLLAHTASLTKTIAEKDKVIGQVVGNLNSVLATVNSRSEELSGLIVQLQKLVSGLAADRGSVGSALSAMDELTNTTAGLLAESRRPLRQDIAGLHELSKNLNGHQALVERVLQNMPNKLTTLSRTASYGSWFNFYLCEASGSVGIGEQELPLPLMPVTQPRCRR